MYSVASIRNVGIPSPEASLDVFTTKAPISISRPRQTTVWVWQCCVLKSLKDVVFVPGSENKQSRIMWIKIIIESRSGQTQHSTNISLSWFNTQELWMSSQDSHLMPSQTQVWAVAGLFPSIHSTQRSHRQTAIGHCLPCGTRSGSVSGVTANLRPEFDEA